MFFSKIWICVYVCQAAKDTTGLKEKKDLIKKKTAKSTKYKIKRKEYDRDKREE